MIIFMVYGGYNIREHWIHCVAKHCPVDTRNILFTTCKLYTDPLYILYKLYLIIYIGSLAYYSVHVIHKLVSQKMNKKFIPLFKFKQGTQGSVQPAFYSYLMFECKNFNKSRVKNRKNNTMRKYWNTQQTVDLGRNCTGNNNHTENVKVHSIYCTRYTW
jgi:hypothetical protein